jgi:hypothetical protein
MDLPKTSDGANLPEPPKRVTFLRRRAIVLSTITVLIVVPLILLIGQLGGGDGGDGRQGTTVIVPPTPNSFTDSKLGISVRWPNGWRKTRKAATIRLVSKDRTTALLISASPGRSRADATRELRSVLLALKSTYRRTRILIDKHPVPLSGLPTGGAVVTGTNRKGVKQKIGVTVARGHEHIYLVEFITPGRGGRLGDVAVIGRTIRLTG